MQMTRLDLAVSVVKQAGSILRTTGNAEYSVEEKSGNQDIVTEYDKKIEQLIVHTIKENYPDDSIVGEEFPKIAGTNFIWYVDPIDGTTNFVNLRYDYCVSLACYESEKPVLGLVLDVSRNILYEGLAGKGAYKNGVQIYTGKSKRIADALLTTPMVQHLFLNDHPHRTAFCELANNVRAVRSRGSVALELCQVAAGEADIFAALHSGPWDHAAAQIILHEAGGASSTIDGAQIQFNGDTTILSAGSKEMLLRVSSFLSGMEE